MNAGYSYESCSSPVFDGGWGYHTHPQQQASIPRQDDAFDVFADPEFKAWIANTICTPPRQWKHPESLDLASLQRPKFLDPCQHFLGPAAGLCEALTLLPVQQQEKLPPPATGCSLCPQHHHLRHSHLCSLCTKCKVELNSIKCMVSTLLASCLKHRALRSWCLGKQLSAALCISAWSSDGLTY